MYIRLGINALFIIFFIIMVIVSSVKYNVHDREMCDRLFFGHIKKIDIMYIENGKDAIINIDFQIYKITKQFLKEYKLTTDLVSYKKFDIESFYKNSTALILYQNCNNALALNFYFTNFEKFGWGIWQALIFYSIIGLIVSSSILGFTIFQIRYLDDQS
jgi:hypothetical protein